MLVTFSVQLRPAGETDDVRVTVPVKLLIGATVIVEDPSAPALVVMAIGLALTLKSGGGELATVTETVSDWVIDPLVPVTVTA